MLAAGTQLGPYKIVAPLGAGGMGEVYRARDTRLGRDVAVKVIPAALAREPERVARFEQEARAAAALSHPNICATYDVGTHEGAPYVVMELLEGESLRQRLSRGPLPARKAIEYAAQAAHGLAAAHEKGIVHRDLKPENLFVTKDGRVKVLDFGLAKLTRPLENDAPQLQAASEAGPTVGMMLGTVGYMSPEQVLGKPADARSDLFALGATLYELVTGRRAFVGATHVDTLHAILNADPGPMTGSGRDVPPALEPIVRRCLEKSPHERFQSASDLAFDLASLSGSQDRLSALATGRSGRISQRSRVVRSIALVLLVLTAAAVGLLVGIDRGERRGGNREVSYQAVTFQRGNVRGARFGPDGRTVYCSAAWDGAPLELFEVTPGKLLPRPVGVTGAGLLAVSRTGALALLLPGPGNAVPAAKGVLGELPPTGGAPRTITELIDAADWAPDGKALAVVRRTPGGSRLEFPIGVPVCSLATGISEVRVSPSGRRLAIVERTAVSQVRGRIVVLDRSGKVLARSAEWRIVSGLAWAPDEREVWYSVAGDDLSHKVAALSMKGAEGVVESFPGSVVLHDIAADGRVLLGADQTQVGIRGRSPDGDRERELGWLDFSSLGRLTRDGRTLVFSEMGLAGGRQYAACLRRQDGSAPVNLGEGWAQDLSPDEKWLLTIHLGPPPSLVLLPNGAGNPVTLPTPGITAFSGARWMPDGRAVLFVGRDTSGSMRTYRQSVPDGVPSPVTPPGLFPLAVSPGGDRLAGVRGGGEVFTIPFGGSEPRTVTTVVPGSFLCGWHADGRSVFVGTRQPRGDVQVQRLDMENGRRTPWEHLALTDSVGTQIANVYFSLDGRAYAYSYRRVSHRLYVVEGLE